MKNKMSFIAAAVTAVMSSTAFAADDTIRVVVSSYTDTSVNKSSGLVSQASINGVSDVCVDSPNFETQWCVPGAVAKSNSVTSQSYSASEASSSKTLKTSIVELNTYGYSKEDVLAALRATGKFDEVVVDVEVKSTYTYSENEPLKSLLDEVFDSAENEASGANVYGANAIIGTPTGDNLDFLVMDSGFFDNSDVPFLEGSGRSFVTRDENVPSDNHQPMEDETFSSCGYHGLSVAGIAGATINNGIGTDGVTNAINLHPIRVMDCGDGYLTDIARALAWADNDEFDLFGDENLDVTPYEGGVGIINLSIAGYTGSEGESGGCPIYVQERIDNLVDNGWIITVSAGNSSSDVMDYAPANCDSVVAVAATDWTGDLASFSNYGEDITISANGENLPSVCEDGVSTCYFSGTSASAPLVGAIMAMVKQHTGIDARSLEMLLKVTSTSRNFGDDCASFDCGAGMVNAEELTIAAQKLVAGELNTIAFALNEGDNCEQVWFVENFGDSANLCELYSVKFLGGYTQTEYTYQLVYTDSGLDIQDEANQTLVGEYSQGNVMLKDLDIDGFDYGFKICENGTCGEVFEMNTSAAAESERPTACE
jgi:serine protease